MADLTFRQLEALVAVVEEHSVSAGAHRLRLTPGAVSVALSELEKSLGVQLVRRRRGYGATVTPAGEVAYRQAVDLLAQAELLRGLREQLAGELVGELRLGCFRTLSPWMLPPVASFLADEHPAVQPRFVEADTVQLLADMDNGRIDAAIMYESHVPERMARDSFARTRLHVVLSATHPRAADEGIRLSDLSGESAILLDLEPTLSHVEEILRQAGHLPHIRLRSGNAETIRAMVARGLGYTVIMGRPAGDRSIDGLPLAYVPILDTLPTSEIVLVRSEREHLDPRVKAVAHHLADRFRDGDALAPSG